MEITFMCFKSNIDLQAAETFGLLKNWQNNETLLY